MTWTLADIATALDAHREAANTAARDAPSPEVRGAWLAVRDDLDGAAGLVRRAISVEAATQ